MSNNFHIVIPARWGSSRLPGKMAVDLAGEPLMIRTWNAVKDSGATSVIIAVDHPKLLEIAKQAGADAVMTSVSHDSGTDRVDEVAKIKQWADQEVVINCQGDEPFMTTDAIGQLVESFKNPLTEISTLASPNSPLEADHPGRVKVVFDQQQRALYFSRAPIAFDRDANKLADDSWLHIGVYGYRVKALRAFTSLAPSYLEKVEKLEQLRALEHGISIHVVKLMQGFIHGVDTPEDVERVRAMLQANT